MVTSNECPQPTNEIVNKNIIRQSISSTRVVYGLQCWLSCGTQVTWLSELEQVGCMCALLEKERKRSAQNVTLK